MGAVEPDIRNAWIGVNEIPLQKDLGRRGEKFEVVAIGDEMVHEKGSRRPHTLLKVGNQIPCSPDFLLSDDQDTAVGVESVAHR
ncbi:MAG: hypothetical protein EBX95_11365 [Acidimicrobiia bacterium]|nr:hypothetical protein [Acidimicrobiia bacterium]